MNRKRLRQNGFGLMQIFLWGIGIALVAVVAMKGIPSFIAYKTVLTAIKRIAAESGPNTTVSQVKSAFSKQMEIDYVRNITAEDLDVYKEDNQIVIAFTMTDKIKLVGPVSLVIDYSGSSKAAKE
jgi:anionic cell wall polymer biosynthesis LytR-Cps2A-Psr (LCP) family protein